MESIFNFFRSLFFGSGSSELGDGRAAIVADISIKAQGAVAQSEDRTDTGNESLPQRAALRPVFESYSSALTGRHSAGTHFSSTSNHASSFDWSVFEIQERPFQKYETDKWCFWKVTRNGIENCKTDVFQSSNRESKILKNGITYPKEFGQKENLSGYWFHGTDYENALSILQNGVILNRGKKSQDFSHGNGFYLTPSFESGKNWACQDRRQRPAVVVFKIRHFNFEGLYLKNHQEWQAIVRHNRSGRRVPIKDVDSGDEDVDLRRRYDDCDYVFGPVNGGKAGARPADGDYARWEPSGFWKKYMQMCVKSESLAVLFGEENAIESIIIFE